MSFIRAFQQWYSTQTIPESLETIHWLLDYVKANGGEPISAADTSSWYDMRDLVLGICKGPVLDASISFDTFKEILTLAQIFEDKGVKPEAIASAIANGIDDAKWELLYDQFRKSLVRERPLKPGDIVVRPTPMSEISRRKDARKRGGRTNTDNMPSASYETKSCRLAPDSCNQYKVVYDTDATEALAKFPSQQKPVTVCVATLNDDFSEFTPASDCRTGGGPGDCLFYGIAPLNPAQQATRAERILAHASAHEIDFIIFPELFADLKLRDNLLATFAAAPGKTRLLVAGSIHPCDGGKQRNECRAVFYNPVTGDFSHPLLQNKIRPYSYEHDGNRYTEDLAASSELRVFTGRDWSLAFLICLDLLDRKLQLLVEALGITVLVVPAFSSKTDEFVRAARDLSAFPGEVCIIVANGPDKVSSKAVWSPAIFSWPDCEDTIPAKKFVNAPMAIVYDSKWHAIDYITF